MKWFDVRQEGSQIPVMNQEIICATCKFYQSEDSRCLRYPPQVYPVVETDSEGNVSTEWDSEFPFAFDTSWCGEHQPIPAPPVVTTTVKVLQGAKS